VAVNRWWIYQRERFPIAAHGPLIAAFSFSAISYSALVRGAATLPGWRQILVAFSSAFLFFLQLRLADEFKDFEEDSRYRPYRPVPRGLIKLRELAYAWAGCILIQFALAVWLAPRLLAFLMITWSYLILMSKEFFVRDWLKRNATVYMVSHMVIMPLVDLYTTACDWIPAGYRRPPNGLLWFLLVSFFNGMVIEIGRKIRSPQDEEKGVETYSFLWGRRNAVAAWLAAMTATAVVAYAAARGIRFQQPIAGLLLILIVVSLVIGGFFLSHSKPHRGKWLETMSGVWSLLMYLSLGTIPLLLRYYGVRI
jgi:4-hydroxybenzoate polyprenyltransferase